MPQIGPDIVSKLGALLTPVSLPSTVVKLDRGRLGCGHCDQELVSGKEKRT
jgi:hypothetical protein